MTSAYADILKRIDAAIEAARVVFERFTPGAIATEYKIGHDPVTEADRAVDAAMRKELLREGEGWLSEESVDDVSRLSKKHVWVVDPLDGTREFVQGIPEFCVSIGFVEDGRPVAGGIYNPATKEKIVGAIDCGVLYNGQPAKPSQRTDLKGSRDSRQPQRTETRRVATLPERRLYEIRPMGSVAYKLGLVAAGKADVTFTLTPKNEWDVAAGVALVESAGGFTSTLDNRPLQCNRKNPLLSGLLASGPFLRDQLLDAVQAHIPAAATASRA